MSEHRPPGRRVVEGLGDPASYDRCSHGPGRMSRAPYKDIDQVMADQVDLVRPLHVLRQVFDDKGL